MTKQLTLIYPYANNSRSARDLANAMGIARVRSNDDTILGQEFSVINWGATKLPNRVLSAGRILNPPAAIRKVNAKDTFMKLAADTPGGPVVPAFTADPEVALNWVHAGNEVVGRSKLRASGGAGIFFGTDKKNIENFLDCPFFTMYVPKKHEYRVHFMGDQVLDIQQKMLRKTDDMGNPIDPRQVDWRVRNHTHGFIFARNNLDVHPDVIEQARRAHVMTKLHFGAYDVIFNDAKKKAYVLEVNTAPGLMGQTLEKYSKALTEVLGLAA